jgi:hypothetical protein
MTGNEKIQVVIDTIGKALEELIAGNVIRLYSGVLTSKGLDLDEQKQVLDLLAKDKKIKYTQANLYQSEADIDPQERVEIAEMAAWDAVPEHLIIEQVLQSLTYEIEVLDNFKRTKPAEDRSSQAEEPSGNVKATLKVTLMGVPEVTAGGHTYVFNTMRAGAPFSIITYCLTHYPNQLVGSGQLKNELKAGKSEDLSYHGIGNLKENIRKSLFDEDQPLSCFVEVSPKAIIVNNNAQLNNDELQKIINGCKKVV